MRLNARALLRRVGINVSRVDGNIYRRVSLKTDQPFKGNVLLAYVLEPFLAREGERPSQAHTHHNESLLIAQVFLNRGYNVDVIDYRNEIFQPSKVYRFFVSARTNFVQVGQKLNENCVKIAHMDTAHFLFNNAAAYGRLLELQQRRGTTLTSVKMVEPNFAAEFADFLMILGNEFDESTYRYAGKPMYPLLVPTPNVYPYFQEKDFDRCRNRFLWMGSHGLVHKGLDRVLEAFDGLPEHHLTVCGGIEHPCEQPFRTAYQEELYKRPNIHTVGWVDVGSEAFLEITRSCAALIYPSCSEANCGTVVTCLQAGLIPLISYESGVDVDDFGVILPDCTPDGVQRAVLELSSKSSGDLERMSRRAFEHARANHTSDAYLRRFAEIVEAIESETS